MAFIGQKQKKIWMNSERKWKVCFIKVPLFLLKNASYKPYCFFRGILDTLPMFGFEFLLGNYFQFFLIFDMPFWTWAWHNVSHRLFLIYVIMFFPYKVYLSTNILFQGGLQQSRLGCDIICLSSKLPGSTGMFSGYIFWPNPLGHESSS